MMIADTPTCHSTDVAREAAAAARGAKRAGPDTFGMPELFVAKVGARSFTWEPRRFRGIVLQHGPGSFDLLGEARADRAKALAGLCAEPDLPRSERRR